jgi:hypothetical protein
MRKIRFKGAAAVAAIAATVLALGACVTINIYFPAAAAEKAADKIIDEVWQIKKNADAANKPAESVKRPDPPGPSGAK